MATLGEFGSNYINGDIQSDIRERGGEQESEWAGGGGELMIRKTNHQWESHKNYEPCER